MDFIRGSEWRKWDLQVQTRLDKVYRTLGSEHNLSDDDFKNLLELSGLTEKEVTLSESQMDAKKYAKLLLAYTKLFTDIKVLGITDHNRGDEIDVLLAESEEFDISIIPGVEVSSSHGIHMLCLFDPSKKWKSTWAKSIEHLMTELGCLECFDSASRPQNCQNTSQQIMEKVTKHGGLTIFAHIATENGLFKKSSTANGGLAHADIYTHAECKAVQIPSKGTIDIGTKNSIEGKDPNYGSKKVAQIRCSDSRSLKDIGSSYTWIKANPTFSGLEQAINEHEERISLKTKPDLLRRIELNSTKIIDNLSISKSPTSDLKKEDWFANISLPLNPGLTAVIGNKGNGKSALADIIGLLGNSRQYDHFSFLNGEKFKKGKLPKSLAFNATITWLNKETHSMCLNDETDNNAIEKVKYIPQNYLEKICNDVELVSNSTFDSEIQSVIFSHVDYQDRLSCQNLEELIKKKSQSIENNCAFLREKMITLNQKIFELENKLSKRSAENLKNKIKEKEDQLKALKEPTPEPAPSEDQKTQETVQTSALSLEKLRAEVTDLESSLRKSEQKISDLNTKQVQLSTTLSEIQGYQKRFIEFKEKQKVILGAYDIDVDSVIKSLIDVSLISVKISEIEGLISQEKSLIFDEKNQNKILISIEAKVEAMRIIEQELDAPNRKYQAYLKEVDSWKKAKEEIEGTLEISGSLMQLRQEEKSLTSLKETLNTLLESRHAICKEIFVEIDKLKKEYETLYAPIQKFMDSTESNPDIELSFSAGLIYNDFSSSFLNFINKTKSGTFKGSEDSQKKILEILKSSDFQSSIGIRAFIDKILEVLVSGSGDTAAARIQEQLTNPAKILEFYNYIFSLSYLTPKYELRWSGKTPVELSPGERGCMLLVFYLLLDKRDHPLLIDQPEENLDNQTIFKILVPCVRKAKSKRQIIVVTHNPNIAVNCDADQIICASIDKRNKNKVSYTCGAIEDEAIKDQIINILEGTIPAFVKRSGTYRIQRAA